jgi:hypothetical protein
VYSFTNQWQNIVGGVHVNVYAGYDRQNPSVGLIVVQATSINGKRASAPIVFRVGGYPGALRVVAAKGAVLTLESASGRAFTFDVANLRVSAS